MSAWKRLSGLLMLSAMLAAPYAGEYAKNRIDAAHSARAYARAPAAGFVGALNPTPARVSGEGARSNDAARVHGIEVHGPAWFREKVKQALDLLERKDPENYRLVVENVTEIRADQTVTGIGVSARVYPNTGTVRYKPWREELPRSVAVTLVHEATHVYAYKNGLPYSGEEGERLASEKADEAMGRLYRLTRK